MKNRKNRLISVFRIFRIAAIILPTSAICYAQVPADFTHLFDSVHATGDPLQDDIGKQVSAIFRNNNFAMALANGKYRVFVHSGRSAGTFEKYLMFSSVTGDSVDTAVQTSISVQIQSSQFLLLIPIDKATSPVVKDGAGTQIVMYKSPKYWYAYCRRTKTGQSFSFNALNVYNADVKFEPVPGRYLLWVPLDKSIMVNIEDPFK